MADEVMVSGLLVILLFVYLMITILQICASPATASAVQPLKHRLVNMLCAFVLFVNGVFAVMHFGSPTNEPLVSITILLRAVVGIVYTLAALNFLVKTFHALYQSKLQQESAPTWLLLSFKIVVWVSILIFCACIVLAFVYEDQFYLDFYYMYLVMFAGIMSIVTMIGFFDVIRKMNQMLESVQKMRTSFQNSHHTAETNTNTTVVDIEKEEKADDNIDDLGDQGEIKKQTTFTQLTQQERDRYDPKPDNNENVESRQQRSGSHGMYEILLATTKRLKYTAVALLLVFGICIYTSLIRIEQLTKKYLYSQLYPLSGYVTYIIFVLSLLTVLMVWVWEPMDFHNKEKFTICYLCCIGTDEEILRNDKDQDDGSNVTKEGSHEKELTQFASDDEDGKPGEDGGLELISFPISRQQSERIATKFVIFNVEVFFKDISLFYTLSRNKKFRLDQVTYENLVQSLGGDKYYEKLNTYLRSWNRKAALFVTHPYCTTDSIEMILDKLDLLDYFRGNISRFVKVENEPRIDINYNYRVIGKDSEYYHLLLDRNEVDQIITKSTISYDSTSKKRKQPSSTKKRNSYVVGKAGTFTTTNDQNNDNRRPTDSLAPTINQNGISKNNNNNKNNKKSKKKLNKSIHLVVLEFIKIFNLNNDEILYVDCTEATINHMQNINLCKTLKAHSHHAMQLQHHGKPKKSQSDEDIERNSGNESDSEPSEDHWIMTQNIFDMIGTQLHDISIRSKSTSPTPTDP